MHMRLTTDPAMTARSTRAPRMAARHGKRQPRASPTRARTPVRVCTRAGCRATRAPASAVRPARRTSVVPSIRSATRARPTRSRPARAPETAATRANRLRRRACPPAHRAPPTVRVAAHRTPVSYDPTLRLPKAACAGLSRDDDANQRGLFGSLGVDGQPGPVLHRQVHRHFGVLLDHCNEKLAIKRKATTYLLDAHHGVVDQVPPSWVQALIRIADSAGS